MKRETKKQRPADLGITRDVYRLRAMEERAERAAASVGKMAAEIAEVLQAVRSMRERAEQRAEILADAHGGGPPGMGGD